MALTPAKIQTVFESTSGIIGLLIESKSSYVINNVSMTRNEKKLHNCNLVT